MIYALDDPVLLHCVPYSRFYFLRVDDKNGLPCSPNAEQPAIVEIVGRDTSGRATYEYDSVTNPMTVRYTKNHGHFLTGISFTYVHDLSRRLRVDHASLYYVASGTRPTTATGGCTALGNKMCDMATCATCCYWAACFVIQAYPTQILPTTSRPQYWFTHSLKLVYLIQPKHSRLLFLL
ncbi:hypothetical protein B0H34DRAFT_426491 [Crassisporium funariophilum]|nr:hypothetical protein B0H34DRAFT_426491 [Crassisporium funariophilum]